MKKETIIGIVVCAVLVIAGIIFASVLISAVNDYNIDEKEFVGTYEAHVSGSSSILTINDDHTFSVSYFNISGTWHQLGGRSINSNESVSPGANKSWVYVEVSSDRDNCNVLETSIRIDNETYHPKYFRRS